MCLYPKLVPNPKYKPNKKNNGIPAKCTDERTLFVPAGCGRCIECRKAKANNWCIRLKQDLRTQKGYFVTLTFSDASLSLLANKINQKKWQLQFDDVEEDCNAVAALAVRYYLERVRKKTKKSVKHWLITELGHKQTGGEEVKTNRIHLHGIIFTDNDINDILDCWQYGFYHIGDYCNEQTISYITKYVTKIDEDNKNFEGKIFCSKGIGKDYIKSEDLKLCKYNGEDTREYLTDEKGYKKALPIYYRCKIYTEDQREKLWINKINKKTRFVMGVKVDLRDENTYINILKTAQERNKLLGYGDDTADWQPKRYKMTFKKLNKVLKTC